ncbi:MAG: Wzz/FepE/Etk N-terminal domain-containing protein [Bacteroidota bacterium]
MEPLTVQRSSRQDSLRPGRGDHPEAGASSAGTDGWTYARAIYQHWRLIAAVTLASAVVAVGIALLVPRQYASEARLLKPEDTTGFSLGALLGSAGGAVGGLLTGGGEYSRYLTILTSRTMMDTIIDRFDLVEVYGFADQEHPLSATREELRDNVEYEVDLEYDYLTIRAYDRDADRAANIANTLVEELGREHVRLTSENARRTRVAVEARLGEAEAALDSVRGSLQDFQEEYGVTELESQARALLEAVAQVKATEAQLTVEYQALADQFGSENPTVVAARAARDAARGEARRLLSGQDAALPIALEDLPSLGRQYAGLVQEQLIQTTIIESIYPLYEQARFREESEAQAVQVVDAAEPTVVPARPSRKVLVVLLTLSGVLLACGYVVVRAWTRLHLPELASRLREPSRQDA